MATKKKSKLSLNAKIFIGIAIVLAALVIFGGTPQAAKFYAAIGGPTSTKSGTSLVGSPLPPSTISGPSGSQGNALPTQTSCIIGTSKSCYTGPSGTENVGICKGGTQYCGPDKKWSTCNGQVTPSAESTSDTCKDGKDNDCDGTTDCSDKSCDGVICNTLVWNTNGIYGSCDQHCSYNQNSCMPCEVTNWQETNCADGVDNEPTTYKDGKIDCADPDCNGKSCGTIQCQEPPSVCDGTCKNSACSCCP